MRRQVLGGICLLLVTATLLAATGAHVLLEARDLKNQPLAGFRFSYEEVKSAPTNKKGATELDLPPKQQTGQKIKIQLVPGSKQADDWFLINPGVNIPNESMSAEVVLMRRSEFRQIAAATRDARRVTSPKKLTAEDRKRNLIAEAARHGLSEEQLETALRSFSETQNPKDKGIAFYLSGQFSNAEKLLNKAAEKEESDLAETLRYLGASQFEQAKYEAANGSFRKALSLKGENVELLSWLGEVLRELAKWQEAEVLMHRVLEMDEKKYGIEHPSVARDLNHLAVLLEKMNRPAEAEPLARRALEIDEKRFGPEHPNVASHLNTLASALKDMNRIAEAEPLMRRALDITEKSLGKEHPEVAASLELLAQLLQATSRPDEAEPLLRRALAIDEKSFGPEHPNIATDLVNLAVLLLKTDRLTEAEPLLRRALAIDEKVFGKEHYEVAADLNELAQVLKSTNRLEEAEPLMRQALEIDEKSFGKDDPTVARDLNNLARLLQITNRLAEAEPLLLRALSIDENSLGKDHPKVAIRLNNLVLLLVATNRLAEAEPLMRRAVLIFIEFEHRTGHEHPDHALIAGNYRKLLQKMGKSDAEIQATVERLEKSYQAQP